MDNEITYQYVFDFKTEATKWDEIPLDFSTLYPARLSVEEQQDVVLLATNIIQENFHHGMELTDPNDVRKHLQVLLAGKKDEVFCMLFLDTRHRIIAFEEMFQGTIDGATVHPRVIARRALELNAAAGIMVHNHPSGVAEPSHADIQITGRVKTALAVLDVRILDHIVVSAEGTVSLAQRGHL